MTSNIHLQIVGGFQILAAEGDMDRLFEFYGRMFARLPVEVKHTGDLTRFLSYQHPIITGEILHFFGIEVERIADIPAGLIAWELRGDSWSMWEAGRDQPTLRQKIAWEWGESTGGRFTGEFAPHKNTAQPVRLAGHLYVDLIWQSTNHDEVILVEHDPAWAQQFEQIAAWLRKSLGPLALRIEHYGSTAIPGIPAKPLIDVLVEIPSFDEARSRLIPLFNRPEWEYWWYKEHMMFIRRTGIGGPRTHHLHIAPKDHPLWEGLIFRDYLRDHPDDAAQYAALKQQLAADFSSDRERYTQAKTDFVQQILAKAARTP